jgi:ferredoxin
LIITEQKSEEALFSFLGKARKVVLLGCTECAALCRTGGAEQLLEFEKKLSPRGVEVLARLVLDPACNAQRVRLSLQKSGRGIGALLSEADAVFCFSCGDGTQTVARLMGQLEYASHIPVYPGNDTLFLGEIVRAEDYVEGCRACGQCELGWTGGICPVTQCAKGLLNGPCGGAKGRMCEVNDEEECAWLRIYDRLEALDQLDNLLEIRPPRDHLKNVHPRRHSTRKPRAAKAQERGIGEGSLPQTES